MDIHNGMRDNISQILLRILEDMNAKKSKEFISNIHQKMQADCIPKEIANEIIDILYVEESLLKTALMDRIETEIIKESNRQRKE